MEMLLRVLLLTKYGRMGASSRMRTLQYVPWLEKSGIEVEVQYLLPDEMLSQRYQKGGYGLPLVKSYAQRCRALLRREQFALLWIEKEALPWWPLSFEQSLLDGVSYVLDYDDAIFHNYDMHSNPVLRRLFKHRLDGLMAKAALVVSGNSYLAKRAHDAGAPWVEVLPTVVDVSGYSATGSAKASSLDGLLRVVWIGSPSTTRYLRLLHEPLKILSKRVPFVLRVIGGGDDFRLAGVTVENFEWTEESEAASIASCDIGIMPLLDTPWERGKCGYKLIQYMACGLPVVASSVGVNQEIVCDANGFLANTDTDWVEQLFTLLHDKRRRLAMGAQGRKLIEMKYCIQQTGPHLVELLRSAARGSHRFSTMSARPGKAG